MPVTFLITVAIVTLLDRPIPHALLQCDHIVRMTDEQQYEDDENPPSAENGPGAILKTDSRGHMVLTYPKGTLHCAAWGKGFARKEFTIFVESSMVVTVPLAKE